MSKRTWIILGATSIIAKQFAGLVAEEGAQLRLIGRDQQQLELIANDLKIRYKVSCELQLIDFNQLEDSLALFEPQQDTEFDLFIAQSDFTDNNHLTDETINQLININIRSTVLVINQYLKTQQTRHNLIYLSSVAACRGRAKNSLYGASKATIEVYLQGLQQQATAKQHLTIARLGYIDTKQTYGLPGIFYAADPKDCAAACLNAVKYNKAMVYYPRFWHAIMAIIMRLPFFIYKKMGSI